MHAHVMYDGLHSTKLSDQTLCLVIAQNISIRPVMKNSSAGCFIAFLWLDAKVQVNCQLYILVNEGGRQFTRRVVKAFECLVGQPTRRIITKLVHWSSLTNMADILRSSRCILEPNQRSSMSLIGSLKEPWGGGLVLLWFVRSMLQLSVWGVSTTLQTSNSMFGGIYSLVRLIFAAEEWLFTLVLFPPLQVCYTLFSTLNIVLFLLLQSPWVPVT